MEGRIWEAGKSAEKKEGEEEGKEATEAIGGEEESNDIGGEDEAPLSSPPLIVMT